MENGKEKEKKKYRFEIGQKIWLNHTHEVATIISIDKKGLMYVRAGGMSIPVFMNDVSTEIPEDDKINPEVKATKKPEKVKDEKTYFIDETKFAESGIFLLFIPERKKDGEVVHYDLCLLNDTSTGAEVLFKVMNESKIFEQGKITLTSKQIIRLTHFNAEVLNDISSVEILFKPTSETLEAFSFNQKISASSFIKKLQHFAILKQEVHVYEVIKSFRTKPVKKKPVEKDFFKESEKEFEFDAAFIKQMMTEKPTAKEHEVIIPEKEVDLHIEAIVREPENMDKTDILLIQVEHFNRSLDRAIRSGQKIFYAIHGNGKGRLKKEIEKVLSQHSEVKSFNNNYHHRYGFGATEILLK